MVKKKRTPKKARASRQSDLPHVNICQRCNTEITTGEPLLCGAACTVLHADEKDRHG